MRRFNFVKVIFVMLVMIFSASVYADNQKIGFVDFEKVFNNYKRTRDENQTLQRIKEEKEKAAWQSSAAPAPEAATPVAETLAAAQPVAAPEKEAEKSSGEAYIETPRCASCNECIQINDKMFAYDGNKQAFIANLKAGTYAQLVEAAENCQVAIIHPGKPQNPNEAGLDDLLKRAEAFM